MKPFRKDRSYYFPLSEPTMDRQFSSLFSPFLRGQSSTFLVKRGFGGGRACIKFMLCNVDEFAEKCHLPVSNSTHTYVYVDPDLLEHQTASAYERLIFTSIFRKILSSEPITTLENVCKAIWSHLETKEMVIVLAGMNYLTFTQAPLWSRTHLLQVYPEKVHFLYVIYEGGPLRMCDERFRRIRNLLHQNVVRFDHLSMSDIEYSIDRWAYTLEYTFSEQQRKEIKTVSRGQPLFLKTCCFAMYDISKNNKRIKLEDHPSVCSVQKYEHSFSLENSKLVHALSEVLSSKEYDVLMTFIDAGDRVVSRDEVASSLWGDDPEKYSDGAITQIVSRVNQKLCAVKACELSLRAVYRRGYKLQRNVKK